MLDLVLSCNWLLAAGATAGAVLPIPSQHKNTASSTITIELLVGNGTGEHTKSDQRSPKSVS
jgi:hypothetical protein